jgi:hypothetical protein
MRSRVSRGIAIAALALGVCIVGFAGVSLAVSGNDGTTGKTAQTPLGIQSAGATPGSGVQNEVAAGGQTPGGSNPGGGSGSGNAPVRTVGSSGGSGGGSSLPFTGLLVIPVLLVGLGLLGTGLVLRRREISGAVSS